jgi:hypothetical protein
MTLLHGASLTVKYLVEGLVSLQKRISIVLSYIIIYANTVTVIKQFSVLQHVSTCIYLLQVIFNAGSFYSCLLYLHSSMTLLDYVFVMDCVAVLWMFS